MSISTDTWGQDYQKRFGCLPGTDDPEQERHRWGQMYSELLEECNRLRGENALLKMERENYLRQSHAKACQELGSKEAMLSLVGQQPPFRQFVQQVAKEGG